VTNAARKTRETSIAAVRAAMRVAGVPLAPRDRVHFEAAFGCDLSQVRVHTDELAAAAASAVNAHAFAVGRDIFFAAGAFKPDTPRGRTVIAHEIAHVLQDPRRVEAVELDAAVEVTSPDDAVEIGANAAAAAIATGRLPAAAPAGGVPRARIARLVAGLLDRRDPRDPAQLVARLTETVRTTLSGDPDDRLGRVRRSLLGLDDRTRRLVFERLEAQLVSADWHHLIDVLDQPMPAGTDGGDGRELPADPSPQSAEDERAAAAAEKPAEAEKPQAPPAGTQPDAETMKDVAAPPLAPSAETAPAPEQGGKPAARAAHPNLRGAKPHHPPAGARAAPARKARKPMGGGTAPPITAGGGAPEAAEPGAPPEAAPPVESEAELRAGAQIARTPEPPGTSQAEAAEPADPGAIPADLQVEETETAPRAEVAAAPASAESPPPAPPPGIEGVEAPPSEPAPAAAEAAPAPAPQQESMDREAAAGLQAEAAAPDAATPEGEVTATRVPPGEAPAADDAAAPEQDGEVTATRVARAPGGAAPAGAMPPIGDLPSEQDDGHEDTGGGGGGGAAIPDAPEEAPVAGPANADPASAMSSIAALDPVPAQQALGGVTAAVGRTVAADHGELANAPPEAKPPAAPPGGAQAKPVAAASAAPGTVAKIPTAAPPPATKVVVPPVTGPMPEMPAPHVTSNAEGQLTAADAQHISESVSELPVSDPALNVTAGAAPTLALVAAADPQRAAEQRDAVAKSTQTAAAAARRDAALPMGEDHIVPTVPSETLRGTVPAAAAKAGGGAAAAPAGADAGVAVVAREKSGDQVRAAATAGSQDLTAKRAEQQSKMTQARADSQRDMDTQVAAAGTAQNAERSKARGEVVASRRQWGSEQSDTLAKADADADQEVVVARRQAVTYQKNAHDEADGHIADGNKKITTARAEAENKARAERERARNESKNDGFFSRLASAIGSFFDGIRNAIHAAFDAARKLVAGAIAVAQRLAAAVIDRVRDAVVGLIQLAGKALIAIGDRVLAAFPKLREKFHNAINKLVDGAVAAVNKIADGLKKAVKTLLDLLGKALTALLDAYEALYMAAVNAVASAVKFAIDAAKAIVQALGVFARLIVDIASSPGQWLRNLGAALLDGVRNHLWAAFKAAVKEWFNSKVEAVVGIGKLIFEVLKKGGIPFSRIAKMVWVAVKAAIPRAIIEFLIQKVISLLVPAAAAIMAIIEGLQAAWATASRIIAAFGLFVDFLKQVKGGNAGPAFARAVAAAVIVVIEFTANFIISKIGKGAKGVGSKLGAIAAKIMAFLKKGVAAVGRVLKKVGKAIVRAVKAAGRALRAALKWIADSKLGQALRAAGRWLANTKLGKAIAKAYQAIKKKIQDAKAKIKKWWEDRKKNQPSPEEKKAKARRDLVPIIQRYAETGGSHRLLRLRYAWWRWRYGLKTLHETSGGDTTSVLMSASAEESLFSGLLNLTEARILKAVREAANDLAKDPAVQDHLRQLQSDRAKQRGKEPAGSETRPLIQSPGVGMIAEAEYMASHPRPRGTTTHLQVFGVPITERQTWSSSLGHVYTQDPQGSGFHYDDIGASAAEIAKMIGGKDPAKAFGEAQAIMHGSGLKGLPKDSPLRASKDLFAPVVRVQTVEMARNRAQIIRQATLSEIMKYGGSTIREGVGYRGDEHDHGNLNPMARRGATRQSAFADADVLGFDPRQTYATAPPHEDVKGFIETELRAMERYILVLAQTEEPTLMRQDVLDRWVRRHMRDHLLALGKEYFKL
jgi:hypothetical protein